MSSRTNVVTIGGLEEWAKALSEGQRDDGEIKGVTTQELADQMRCNVATARTKLRAMIQAGRAKFVGQRNILRMDGRSNTVPVYALVKCK